ncbi:septum formation initiator family protein [Candidatus Roizmanbacteria bacterium]|nr:septum formation initiator family protein [Candidatus Roizmanbacteria bacterium]
MNFLKRAAILFLLFILFSSLIKNIFDYRNKIAFYRDYQTQYETEKKRNLVLHTQILKKSDPQEVEKTIRNRLNLSKENEMTVILAEPSPTPTSLPEPSLANWQKWKNLFFSR